ncbi:MAG: hypothetical protein D6689_11485 [Deltaproteobacteria bacterium]|nr:MAG: hypothetical protein D6689_11485 [Deltaproteobacteria bacterium]
MSRRRVLAISQDLDQLRRIVANLERAGAEVDAVRSADAVENEIIPHRYIFYGLDDLESLERAIPRLRDKAHVACILKDGRLNELTRILADHRVNHVIVGDELDRGVFVTAQKLLTGDIFGIEKYLPEGTPVNYIRLRDFQGRGQAIDRILEFAEQTKMRRQVRSAIGQVCEELLMNALYDAPVDEFGNQVFADIDPHDRTATRSPRPVSIRYAATDTQFAVAVRDRFGRLAKNTILAYINKCLHSSQQIDRKTYGAGLGLYLVANAAASYIVNVAYNIATEVVCTFDRGKKVPLRLVGVFVHPGQAEMLRDGPTPETNPLARRGG